MHLQRDDPVTAKGVVKSKFGPSVFEQLRASLDRCRGYRELGDLDAGRILGRALARPNGDAESSQKQWPEKEERC
jgi:hypothetical protein